MKSILLAVTFWITSNAAYADTFCLDKSKLDSKDTLAEASAPRLERASLGSADVLTTESLTEKASVPFYKDDPVSDFYCIDGQKRFFNSDPNALFFNPDKQSAFWDRAENRWDEAFWN